jgi:ribosomal protein RSM22 (predicted rRNA methylase)
MWPPAAHLKKNSSTSTRHVYRNHRGLGYESCTSSVRTWRSIDRPWRQNRYARTQHDVALVSPLELIEKTSNACKRVLALATHRSTTIYSTVHTRRSARLIYEKCTVEETPRLAEARKSKTTPQARTCANMYVYLSLGGMWIINDKY